MLLSRTIAANLPSGSARLSFYSQLFEEKGHPIGTGKNKPVIGRKLRKIKTMPRYWPQLYCRKTQGFPALEDNLLGSSQPGAGRVINTLLPKRGCFLATAVFPRAPHSLPLKQPGPTILLPGEALNVGQSPHNCLLVRSGPPTDHCRRGFSLHPSSRRPLIITLRFLYPIR